MEFNFSQIDLKQEAETREKIYFAVILLLIVIAFSRWFYLPKIQEIKMIQVEANNANLQIYANAANAFIKFAAICRIRIFIRSISIILLFVFLIFMISLGPFFLGRFSRFGF